MKKQQEKAGFTIIEVVLVLAIAGLIFLMVFVGFPALQRSQRDTQRRNDVARVVTQLIQYKTNNNNLPTGSGVYTSAKQTLSESWLSFLTNYMKMVGNPGGTSNEGSEFKDPSTGNNYYFAIITGCKSSYDAENGLCTTQNTSTRTIYITKNATCGNGGAMHSGNTNDLVVTISLESGGIYCARV